MLAGRNCPTVNRDSRCQARRLLIPYNRALLICDGNFIVASDAHSRSTGGLTKLVTPALLAYWLLMFVATHIPNPELLPAPDVSDKLLHFAAYFVLYSLLCLRHQVFRAEWPDAVSQSKLMSVTVVYAVVDELLQAIPAVNRTADWKDGLADCGGIVSAAILVSILRLSQRSHHTNAE